MSTPDAHTADLADALQPFAPRLETHWFVCLRVDPVGTTVRYLVWGKDKTRLGEIAWSAHDHCYTFTARQTPWRYVAKCLQDLGEICQYLTQRQRRRQAAQRRRGTSS